MSAIVQINSNLKGRQHSHKLEPVTVMVGDSFSGKTAMLESIKILLLGYHPKLGRKPHLMRPFIAGTTLTIDGTFGDGKKLHRQWQLKKDAIKYSGDDSEVVPSILFDANEFFALSGKERTAYIFKRLSLDENQTAATVTTRIKGVKVEEPNEHSEAMIQTLVNMVNELDVARTEEGVSFQDFMDTILGDFAELKRDTDTQARQYEGTQRGVTSMQAGSSQTPARDRQKDIDDARKALEDMYTERTTFANKMKEYNLWRGRYTELKQLCENAGDASALLKIHELKQELDDTRILRNDIRLTNEEAAQAYADALKHLNQCNAVVRDIEASVAALNKQIGELDKKHVDTMSMPCCPYCKSAKAGWQKNIESQFKKDHKDLRLQIDHLERTIPKAKESAAEADAQVEQSSKTLGRVSKLQTAINNLTDQIGKLESSNIEIQTRRGQLHELEQNPVDLPSAEVGFQIDKQITQLQNLLPTLEGEQKRFVSESTEHRNILVAQEHFARLKSESEVIANTIKTLVTLQQELIDQSVGQLIDRARQFTDGIMLGKLMYRDGEYGYVGKEGWVSHEAFSGTEEALAYTGLSVALAGEVSNRIVIIDELGIMSDQVKSEVVKRMAMLVNDGVIDQFVAADVRDAKAHSQHGAHVIEL